MAVIGVHALIYTPEAEALRALLADAIGWSHVDAGEGWLIFALPPAELGVHPGDQPRHELSLMCDDIATTVAELTVMGRPAILVPLPHSIDNDQLQNATRLAESGGAWCIEQKELTPERLAGALGRLLSTPESLAQAAAAAKRQGRPDAVVRLADLVEELVGSAEKSA